MDFLHGNCGVISTEFDSIDRGGVGLTIFCHVTVFRQ